MPTGEERESLCLNEALLPDVVITQHCETETILPRCGSPIRFKIAFSQQ